MKLLSTVSVLLLFTINQLQLASTASIPSDIDIASTIEDAHSTGTGSLELITSPHSDSLSSESINNPTGSLLQEAPGYEFFWFYACTLENFKGQCKETNFVEKEGGCWTPGKKWYYNDNIRSLVATRGSYCRFWQHPKCTGMFIADGGRGNLKFTLDESEPIKAPDLNMNDRISSVQCFYKYRPEPERREENEVVTPDGLPEGFDTATLSPLAEKEEDELTYVA